MIGGEDECKAARPHSINACSWCRSSFTHPWQRESWRHCRTGLLPLWPPRSRSLRQDGS
jgi:hypothetical protein